MALPTPFSRTWVTWARALWLLVAVIAGALFVVGAVQSLTTPLPNCPPTSPCSPSLLTQQDVQYLVALGLPAWLGPVGGLAVAWTARLSLALIGAVIFWRRSDDPVAWLLALSMLSGLVESITLPGGWQFFVVLELTVGNAAFLPFPFIFPSGRLEPQRLRRWLVPVLAALFVGLELSTLWPTPFFYGLAAITYAVYLPLAAYAMFYRYRRVSNAVERQQTKWIIVGFLLILLTGVYYLGMSAISGPAPAPNVRLVGLLFGAFFYLLGYVGFAVSLAFAILRYRLWDIDVVIRRTLLYSALTGLLAAIYFGGVVVFQAIFHGLTGQGGSAGIIGSTLLIAALFQPLRLRLQRLIDRYFFRRKYNAAQTLAAFAATARDDINLDQVSERLLAVVDDTLQPASSVVWLKPGSKRPEPPRQR